MLVSVLIVSYRTPGPTCAAVVSALALAEVEEVVVVDNGSNDDTVDRLHAIDDPRLSVVVKEANVGFGKAQNHAARIASGDVVLLLNSDAVLSKTAFDRMLDEVALFAGRCIVGPRLVTPEGAIQRSVGVLPAPWDLSLRALGVGHLRAVGNWIPLFALLTRRTRLVREYGSAEAATETIDTTMVSGACLAMGREAFWELGGFDERFFMYFEDADLCKRAAEAGMPIRFVPSAVVTHIGGASSDGDWHYSPLYARSMRQYLEKWWGAPGVALAVVLLWLRLVTHAVALHRGTGRAWAAFLAGLHPGRAP